MKKIPEALWVYAGALLFFLLTLAENFSGPHDSIHYLNCIIDGHPLANQHHLIYKYVVYGWLHVVQTFLPSVKDFVIVESFTAIWGAGSATVIYLFFRNRFAVSVLPSLLALATVLFSYGIWFYSTNIEVYAPPLCLVLLCLYLLTGKNKRAGTWWIIIALHILSILFHQVNILFTPVILFALWRDQDRSAFRSWFLRYAMAGLVFVGGAYFVMGWVVEKQNSFPKWKRWVEGYTAENTYWKPLSAQTPVQVAYGYGHAFIGGHYIFSFPPVKEAINKSLSSHSIGDELFIARNVSSGMASFLVGLTLLLGAGMLFLLVRFLRKFRLYRQQFGILIDLLLLTWVLYTGFFLFWIPEILEFWLLQTVLLWLLLLGTFLSSPQRSNLFRIGAPLVLASCLFIINYFGSIKWMQDVKNDWYYDKVQRIQQFAGEKDLVLFRDGWIITDFMKYFSKVPYLDVQQADTARAMVDSRILSAQQKGGKLFLLPESNSKYLGSSGAYMDSIRNVFQGRLKLVHPKDPEIWVVE